MSIQRLIISRPHTNEALKQPAKLLFLSLCLLIAGCGGGGSSDDNTTASTTTSSITSTAESLPISTLANNVSEDAEESVSDGQMDIASSDLELINEVGGVGDQLVGMRFLVTIPDNSTITNAYIQFTTDEISTGSSNLLIKGERSTDAAGFTTANYNISARQTTTASINWTPPNWNVVGESSNAQRTPNLSTIIQEIVNLPNWQATSHIAFIISGSGTRTAVSQNSSALLAPKLHIEYTTSPEETVTDNIPVAYSDTLTTVANSAATVNVLTNDQGIVDAPVTLAISRQPSNGSVSIGLNGMMIYTPNNGYSGSDLFTYQITDADGDSDTANVTVSVTPPPADYIPVAVDDDLSLNTNTPTAINVLNNDTGLEDGGITVTINSAPSNGNVSIGQNGILTYTPNTNYAGSDLFTYVITDADGDSDSASVNITVASNIIDYIPVANTDTATTQTVTPVSIAVLSNDTGIEDGPVTVSITSAPSYGTAVVDLDNTITYTPNFGHFGPDSFIYRVTDADSDNAAASVDITVNCTSGVCTKTIRLTWNANPESDLAGYFIHHGTQSGVYTDKIWVGNVTSHDFETAELTDHFFAISATNTANDESGLSSEVSASLAL